MFLYNVTVKDSGKYYCHGENNAGTPFVSFFCN